MDYIVHAFGTSTSWNHNNSYSSLTLTSDSILSFPTPSTLSLHVSSLSTPHFATSYALSTIGQIDGSISYLYSTVPLHSVPSHSTSIPLRSFVRGYRDIGLPIFPFTPKELDSASANASTDGQTRKPTLLYATLALPSPSTLTALYARRVNAATLLSLSLNSKAGPTTQDRGPPSAAVLLHVQRDTGRYSIEALGSTDSALLGVRGLWNLGLGRPKVVEVAKVEEAYSSDAVEGLIDPPVSDVKRPTEEELLAEYEARMASKPSLLSAGAEFYYSPLSSVIGMSTGLRFTTLRPGITRSSQTVVASSSKPLAGASAALSSITQAAPTAHASFPYTLTLTLTPLTGSLASTYSVKPTSNVSLSSKFGFNVYSWESEYVVGAELWRQHKKTPSITVEVEEQSDDPLTWARKKAASWLDSAKEKVASAVEEEDESVVKLRADDGWNIRALWTGRIKELLVSAGVSLSPTPGFKPEELNDLKRWTGKFGVQVAYSS